MAALSKDGFSIRERAQRRSYDAVIVGSGPNGLAAAITIARAGRSVLLVERAPVLGGGTQTAALTLPGFLHDVCSAVHPLGIGSPLLRELPLEKYGLEWVQPPAALAHPLDDGSAVVLERSVQKTAEHLGGDGGAYRRLMEPLVHGWDKLLRDVLGPLRLPHHPLLMGWFGLHAIRSLDKLVRSQFRGAEARALLAGISAHAMLPLTTPVSAAFALLLGMAGHAVGWPIARGGSQRIADAMAALLTRLGGEIITDAEVRSLDELPEAAAILLDLTPRQVVRIGGSRLTSRYRAALDKYRYGPGVFKMDWALAAPIPWRARDCLRAATVHLGGTLDEISASEAAVGAGWVAERPFVLLTQPSLFDSSRAPAGRHTAWAYCHVPHGSAVDMSERIESQIERFAPGFRELVLGRHTLSAPQLEAHNPNYIGGDINGGVADLRQLFARPTSALSPYATSDPGLFICSSATPPGGGVHGMCGYHAARAALGRIEQKAQQKVKEQRRSAARAARATAVQQATASSAGVVGTGASEKERPHRRWALPLAGVALLGLLGLGVQLHLRKKRRWLGLCSRQVTPASQGSLQVDEHRRPPGSAPSTSWHSHQSDFGIPKASWYRRAPRH